MTLGTAVAMPDQLILFGVLHFLGVSMMLFALLRKALEHIPTVWGIAGSLLLFLVTMPLSQGWIGLGPFPTDVTPGTVHKSFVSAGILWGWFFLRRLLSSVSLVFPVFSRQFLGKILEIG